jgi:DNA-binding NarL/FixJ family response regulator
MWSDRQLTEDADPAWTILVVEDQPLVQAWLRKLLDRAFPGSLVVTTDSVAAAVDLLENTIVNVAVIDLYLPDGSGVDVVREVMHRNLATKCVIIAIHDHEDYLIEAMKIGALGYLFKDQPTNVLNDQLRKIVEDVQPPLPPVGQELLQRPGKPKSGEPANIDASDTEALSAREQEVLTLIAKGLQVPQVARVLGITVNTASSHIKNIYRKCHISSRAEAALEAKRLGLV